MTSSRMLRMVAIVSLIGIAILGVGMVLAVGQAAPTAGVLHFEPGLATGVAGGPVDVSVLSNGISNVYGIEFAVAFDPNILTVVDADTEKDGVQITKGTCPAPDFPASNVAHNITGTISYAATQLNPTPPCDGGEAATINFVCSADLLEAVTTPLTFTNSLISDSDGSPLPHETVNGAVRCEADIFFVEGEVALQAWPEPSGVEVVLLNSQGAVYDGPVTLGPDGAFEFQGRVGNSYTVTASYDRYLSSEVVGITSETVGERIPLGLTTLRAGDINGDGAINILDISGVAGNFGKSSSTAWTP